MCWLGREGQKSASVHVQWKRVHGVRQKVLGSGFEPPVILAQGWTDTGPFSELVFLSRISLIRRSKAYMTLNRFADT